MDSTVGRVGAGSKVGVGFSVGMGIGEGGITVRTGATVWFVGEGKVEVGDGVSGTGVKFPGRGSGVMTHPKERTSMSTAKGTATRKPLL